MKNILLLTDFSKNAENAIRYALQLFEADICTFFVLHVEKVSSYTTSNLMTMGNSSVYDSVIKESKHKLAKFVSALELDYKNDNHSFKMLVDYDVMTDAIKQTVKSENIDLIVMGTNGVTGAKEVVFGSNTINVIRKVNYPTLVIPEDFKFRKPKDILLPLDLSDSLSGKAFIELMNFVKKQKSKLHILRIKPRNEKSKEEANDQEHIAYFLKDLNYEYHSINDIPMHYVADCYTQTESIDMTALLVQREDLFERFFIGSSTTQISNEVRVPLLILHS